ncbi:hypothetical protein K466DRAFT_589500 [Polyporus arcularius HHB13444]|uniref:Uncharacterized protein n=1 Tax=Polyporus arcularius HHB13444 TaxID=1314778 RepID=A0A5C3P243_9APHY|nr:hypothetical protein K466DRAFT_589500 [Polyporus arcularius HHB13444]
MLVPSRSLVLTYTDAPSFAHLLSSCRARLAAGPRFLSATRLTAADWDGALRLRLSDGRA